MGEERSSSEIRQEIEAAERREVELKTLINNLEAELERFKKERDALTGGFYRRSGDGTIVRLYVELNASLRREQDSKSPPVVWINDVSPWGDAFVVFKVTAKQIRIRPPGSTQVDLYRLDGTPVHRMKYCIDIRKTFGIDADSVPPNWKPETKKPPKES